MYRTAFLPTIKKPKTYPDVTLFNTKKKVSSISSTSKASPWCLAQIDYSGANEYMDAHYETCKENSYFQFYNKTLISDNFSFNGKSNQSYVNDARDFGRNKRTEIVYNARKGVFDHDSQNLRKPSLSACGFTLEQFPSRICNWHSLSEISSTYLKEIRENLLPQVLPKHKYGKIKNILFWHPMLRDEKHVNLANNVPISFKTRSPDYIPVSSIAPIVHIDTDVGAYPDLSSFLDLVLNNQMTESCSNHTELNMDREQNAYNDEISGSLIQKKTNSTQILTSLENGHRFMILNVWRNISPNPVSRSPLAILSTYYQEERNSKHKPMMEDKNQVTKEKGEFQGYSFPLSKPDMERSWWYTFPKMENDECLVFKQYDRLLPHSSSLNAEELRTISTSDLWHCALQNTNVTADFKMFQTSEVHLEPRQSFDLRIFIVFEQLLSPNEDRFIISRNEKRRPLLSYEESGCFCDEQASKRI